MKTILVDDEPWSMEQFELECKDIPYIKLVGKFCNPIEAYEFAQKTRIDFALLDVEMPGMNGIELGKKLKLLYPDLIIIYITGYEQYIKEAILSVKADYYVLKPYTREDIEDIMSRALSLSARQKKRVFIRTFGNFDMFVDGKLIHFSNAKAKELLALCVDNVGGDVTMEKAVTILWEERSYDKNVKSLYRKALIYLNALFREYGLEKVFESSRGACHINKNEISCDYYDFLSGSISKEQNFNGEYLFEYSWAENTTAKLYYMQKND